MARVPSRSTVVAYWDGNTLAFGTIAGEDKQRLRVVLPGGREDRLLPARIAFEIESSSNPAEDKTEAAQRAQTAALRVAALATDVDVPLIWELARDVAGDSDLGDLASAVLGEDSGVNRAALSLAFLREGIRFMRRGEGWVPRDAAGV